MKQTVSLVLSSGSARGIAHIGVIEELERQGLQIKAIAGSSMGALVGGIYASGNLDVFKDWMCKLDKKAVFSLIDFTLSADGIVKGEKVIKELLKMIPDVNIEDLPISYCAVATDIKNGKEVVFEGGSLFEAIRASISVPTVFKPFHYEEMVLIDGGVLNPIPINRVKRRENDLLIAVDVCAPISHETQITSNKSAIEAANVSIIKENGLRLLPQNNRKQLNYYTILSQSGSLMVQQISALTIAIYQPDILVKIPVNSYESYHFYKSEEIIKLGETTAKKAISEYLINQKDNI